MQLGSPKFTYKKVPWWVLSWKPIYFGVKRSTSVSVFRQNAILTLAVYVNHAGFFPCAGFCTRVSAGVFWFWDSAYKTVCAVQQRTRRRLMCVIWVAVGLSVITCDNEAVCAPCEPQGYKNRSFRFQASYRSRRPYLSIFIFCVPVGVFLYFRFADACPVLLCSATPRGEEGVTVKGICNDFYTKLIKSNFSLLTAIYTRLCNKFW